METKPLRKLSLTETGRKEPITDYTRVNRNCKLEKSWIWPEQVTDLVKSLIIGKSINVCSGASALGDVKIDLEPIPELQTKNNIQITETLDQLLSVRIYACSNSTYLDTGRQ